MTSPFVIVIAGPTGVGKTTLSKMLSKHFNCTYISEDEIAKEVFPDVYKYIEDYPNNVKIVDDQLLERTKEIFDNGKSVIIDRINLDKEFIDDMLLACRIPKHLLNEPNARVSLVQYAQLMNGLTEASEDELIGHGTSPLPLGSMSLLTHWLVAAKNLDQAAQRITRFYQVLGQGQAIHCYKDDELIFFEIKLPVYAQHSDVFIAELCFSNIHRLLSWLAMEVIRVDHVEFQWKEPAYAQDYRLMFYGASCLFEQSKTRIGFSQSILEKPVHQNLPNLEKFLKNPNFEILVLDFKAENLASRVAARIRQRLHSMPSLPELAKDLGTKPYTLQRSLAKEGINYLAIKNQVKRDAAIEMLVSTDLSIEEISSQLGFSETSPFTRTFKEWTGIPPSAYRKYY